MNWIFDLSLWLAIACIVLLLLCVLFLYLYDKERREKRRLSQIIEHYQAQVVEWRKVADDALDLGKRQSQRAIDVLDRVLTEREKEELM